MLKRVSPTINGVYIMDNKTVTIKHKTTCKDTPQQLAGEESTTPTFEHSFDFSNCTDAEILDMAASNMVITWRARNGVKKMNEENVRALPTTIDVHEFMKTTTRGKTKVEKCESIVGKMSDDERKVFLAELTAKYSK